MSAGKLDLIIEKGATFRRTLYWETEAPAAPIDLTGYTARMQIRTKLENSLVLALTTENGRIQLVAVEGRIDLIITAAETMAMTGTDAVYDLEMVKEDEVTRLIEGDVLLSQEVTV